MERKVSKNKIDFSVPENYFSDFDNRLEKKINTSEAIPKVTGFKVPSGYLEDFEKRLWNTMEMEASTARGTKVRWLYAVSSIAATLILGFVLIKTTSPLTTEQVEELTSFDVKTYIDDGFLNLNTYEIIDTFEGVSLEGIEMTDPIPREEIIEYLNQNNIDNYTLTFEEATLLP